MNNFDKKKRIFNEENKFFCEVCNQQTDYSSKAYSFHLKSHNLTPEQYYLQYLAEEGEGVCSCGKPTKLIRISKGMTEFCSNSCAQSDPKIVAKRNNKIDNAEKIRKMRETFRAKYGTDSYFQTQEFKDKMSGKHSEIALKGKESRDKTNLERYGHVNPFGSKVIQGKIKQTNIEKYGVENYAKTEESKDRRSSFWTKEKRKEHSEKLIKIFDDIKDFNLAEELPSGYEIIDSEKVKDVKYRMYSYELKCPKGHDFLIQRQLIRLRKLRNHEICLICNPPGSAQQRDLQEFVKGLIDEGEEIKFNDRKVFSGELELDIFLPKRNCAIEYNGLYFHSDDRLENTYHLRKSLRCEEKGIHLIHVWEDDWLYKTDIVKSRIRNLLGKNEIKIFARECEIFEVSFQEAKEFLIENHIQGWCVSKHNIGLFHEGNLVSLMTFGDLRANLGSKAEEGKFELLRFCNKINHSVVGSASRLLNYFETTYKPDEILSYCDRSWSNGKIYETLGFEKLRASSPNYFYVIDGKRENRWKFRKDQLVKEGFPPEKTEKEIMSERGISRIYDCGNLVFLKKIKERT